MTSKFIQGFFVLLIIAFWSVTIFGADNKTQSKESKTQPAVQSPDEITTEEDIEKNIVKETDLAITTKGLDTLKFSLAEIRKGKSFPNQVTACDDTAGDAYNDGKLTLPDIIVLRNFIFFGGPKPTPTCRGDVNASGTISLSDVIYLVNYILKGGPRPVNSDVCCK